MNKKLQILLVVVVIALVAVGISKAYYPSEEAVAEPTTTIMNIENATIYFGGGVDVDQMREGVSFGGYGDTNVTNLVASGDVTVGDDVTISDDLTVDQITQDSIVHDWVRGSCTDATTTIMSEVNPYGVDVIVDEFYIKIVNGTTTVQYTCGTSSVGVGLSADPTDLLIDDVEIATTTDGTATTSEVVRVVNRIGSGSRTNVGGITDAGTNSEDRIVWETGDYIVCYADEIGITGGITNSENWADCTYGIHTYKVE